MSQTGGLLEALEQKHEFIGRHIGPQGPDQQAMLRELGLSSLEELADKVVPPAIRSDQPLALSEGVTEQQGLARLGEIASRNQVCKSLIGMGYYNTYTPTVIVRNILENPAWYTAYTPYQPEISQGRLEAMLNFQTMVTELTGLDIANASLLDEATAAAEAMALCHRTSRTRRDVFFVCADCHPQTIDVIRTRAEPVGIEVVVGDVRQDFDPAQYFAVLLQYPASTGAVHDYREIVDKARGEKTLVIFAADLLALAVLTPPGELGADIAVGNSQRFGVPLCFGGPHAAYLATRESYKRGVPGRLVGVSVDSRGAKAYRLSLQTREQHIRREKATSNICTAQALLAVMASMYAVYHGPQGLSTIARRVHRLTAVFAEGLGRMGCEVGEEWFFDTVSVRTQSATDAVMSAALARGVNLRRVDDDTVGVSLDETVAREDVQTLWDIFAVAGGQAPDFAAVEADTGERIPESLRRSSAFLTHPVFNSYRSETEMLRYIRHLGDKDLALDRAMIPLGSCTMKLNATTQMLPITWEAFSGIHPFVPAEQAQGYRQLTDELEQMLCACTGYDAVSLQPNAGSQGEFAGLLAIRAWHASRGESHRDICLIPSSAHGTNPASAAMAGMKVVVVGCDEDGNIDVENLQAKAAEHAGRLAAIMITYPSTHGVFEEAVTEVCDIVHRHGGQVYIDGANLNALVGVAYPGRFGGDVSHLNLHKTFCIPHGGGGPGVGPIGVREHLKPFLPGHRLLEHTGRQASMGAVAAAPWGSAGILPISWMYIALMGREGMRHATLAAILNANYIAWRLKEHYPVLYTGPNGMVAHECILDLRPLKEETGVTVDDVAKRLIDYGFHAPTMSFPVSGTLMVEPTESESREELDRFCDAMIRIREEIRGIENGTLNEQDNPLKNAPHTVADLVETHWDRGYTREQAVFPVASLRERKYWSPVGRVDNVYGDRNLVCSCPPLSAYEDAAD